MGMTYMTDDILNDDDFTPPGRPDFRRIGRWKSPQVVMPNGKRSTYGRFSNAGKILDDESNLTDWKLRTVIVGAAFRPELMAQVSTLDPKSDKNELRDISEECLTAGKGRERTVKGVAIHAMFDHIDMGDDWEPAPQWAALCMAYVDALGLWGLQAFPDEVEINCVHHEFRLAGRMDRRYKTTKVLVAPDNRLIPIGSMVAADTKTGQVVEYAAGSYATQLAGYATADKYDVETDETIPFDPPTYPDWGLVVHADSGGTEVQFYWVDLNAGLEGLKLSQQVKGWRQRADLLHLGAGPVLATSSPPQAPVVPQEARSTGWDPTDHPSPADERTGSLYIHTRQRVKAILDHSDIAAKALARAWPVGVPGLKAEGHTWDQLQDIIEVVERVETDYSVPFFPRWMDPEDIDKSNHPSFSDRWGKPRRDQPPTQEAVQSIQDAINMHPRKELLRHWVGKAVEGGIDHNFNTYALSHALLEFASIDTDGWSTDIMSVDDQLSTFLEGSLRALGYKRGLLDLGRINPEHAPGIMQAAFSIVAGTAMLLYQEDGSCILRTNIHRA
jgi:hypothetical protein